MTSAGAAARSTCDNCHFVDEKMSFLREETQKRGFPHRRRRAHGARARSTGSTRTRSGRTAPSTRARVSPATRRQSTGHIDGRVEPARPGAARQFEQLAAWKECGDCAFIPVCAGGCTVASHAELGDMNTPNCHKTSFEAGVVTMARTAALGQIHEIVL